jgi:glucose/arabinose dehydrogenase
VRNSVGFDWHPVTKELWFTDNGRDMMGDDVPPDELNVAPAKGLHFGFPYCHGGTIADPEFGKARPCSDFVPPVQKLGPHVAALGVRVYTGTMFPARYRNQLFIAEHGSWNRSKKIGYRVTLVRLEGDKAVSYEPFAEGWLRGDEAWGRPVDVLVMPDGSMLVSDDEANAIYRISYRGN